MIRFSHFSTLVAALAMCCASVAVAQHVESAESLITVQGLPRLPLYADGGTVLSTANENTLVGYEAPSTELPTVSEDLEQSSLTSYGNVPYQGNWQPPASFTEPRTKLTGLGKYVPESVWTWVPEGSVPFGPRTPDSRRHRGLGVPLTDMSWMTNPCSVGIFYGGLFGTQLVHGEVNQGAGELAGLRFSKDYDHYWGIEKRIGWGTTPINNVHGAPNARFAHSEYADASILWYPLGDSRWRPYLNTGLGMVTQRFQDHCGCSIHEYLLDAPLGGGLKYLYSERLSFRLELLDNLVIGRSEIATQNNFSVAFAADVRFGDITKHLPWNK